MLIFHEGLPGAGKTYEAVVKHLLPAVERGRLVVTNIDGFDRYECIQSCSEVLSIPYETVASRIKYLDDEQVREVWKYADVNCLLIIDEIQNYWPVKKTKLGDEITEFISKHRHLGIDVICIGQDLRDTHNLWKRRIDRKIKFQKLDALGAVKRYRWVAYKAVGDLKFEKTTEGVESYQSRFYGTYDSHVGDDVNAEVYSDKRAILWNSPFMRLVIAFVLVGGVLIPWYLIRQFDHETTSIINVKGKSNEETKPVQSKHMSQSSTAVQATAVTNKLLPESTNDGDEYRSSGREYVEALSKKYRARLAGVLQTDDRQEIYVEYRDESMRVHERLDTAALLHLGWTIRIYGLKMAEIQKQGRIIFLTSWPIESLGEVSQEHNHEVSQKRLNGT